METRVERRRRMKLEAKRKEEAGPVNPGGDTGQHEHEWELCGYENAEGDHTCQLPSGEWITPFWPRITRFPGGQQVISYKCRGCGAMRTALTDSTGSTVIASEEAPPHPSYGETT